MVFGSVKPLELAHIFDNLICVSVRTKRLYQKQDLFY